MSQIFNCGHNYILGSGLSGKDVRALLVMTNTSIDTENDGISVIDDFTTLDEFNGANYARAALDNEAVAVDDGNNRAEYDADDETFSALGNGTRQAQGILLYVHVTDDTDSIPLCYIEFGSTINPGGSDLEFQWNAEGILQLATAA